MNAHHRFVENRYWVLGGRWVDDAAHLPWPRVFGPFRDYESARATARDLNTGRDPRVRYVVVTDVPETVDADRYAPTEAAPSEATPTEGVRAERAMAGA